MKQKLKMKRFWVFITAVCLASQLVFAQDITETVENAFAAGDASTLSKHFNQNIELVIGGPGKIYSKSQALMVIKDFFKKNPPSSFNKLHEGKKENSIFMIGNLETSGDDYRISILLKKSGSSFLIHQIRIQNG